MLRRCSATAKLVRLNSYVQFGYVEAHAQGYCLEVPDQMRIHPHKLDKERRGL